VFIDSKLYSSRNFDCIFSEVIKLLGSVLTVLTFSFSFDSLLVLDFTFVKSKL
jgi:hypothetical protein